MEIAKCLVCKEGIPNNHPRLGGANFAICMGCEFCEYDVFRIGIPGENNFCFTKDSADVQCLMESMDVDSECVVRKEKMRAIKYHALSFEAE